MRERPPGAFWPLLVYCVTCALFVVWSSRSTGTVGAEAEGEFRLRHLQAQLRLTEGGPIIVRRADGVEPSPQDLQTLSQARQLIAEEAAQIAGDESWPPTVREKAAAVWMVARAPGPEGVGFEDRMATLLPPQSERTALGRWLAVAATGGGRDPESMAALEGVDWSPWLQRRVNAWAEAPQAIALGDTAHASAEIPWLERAFSLLSFYTLLFLMGAALVTVSLLRRKNMPGRGMPYEPPGHWTDTGWAGWWVALCWFAASATLQMLFGALGDAVGLPTAFNAVMGLVIQVAVGIMALWLLGGTVNYRGWVAVTHALNDLRVGLEPFVGRALPAVTWALAGFACAVTTVYVSVLVQAFLPIDGDFVSNPVLPLLVAETDPVTRIALFASIIAGAPFFEEIIFRGAVYRQLRARLKPFGATVLSAALFSVIHFDAGSLVPLFALGCVLAVLAERTGGLIVPMFVHALWNGGTILIATTLYGG